MQPIGVNFTGVRATRGEFYRGADQYTVTRIDVIFRYPDRVPLTHVSLNFLLIFLHHRKFPAV